jgi:cobalt-zinc-cadmium efflux system protein
MSHDHHHHNHVDPVETSMARLIGVILLNLAITAGQVIGGLLSGSLALISDALHNFSDAASIVITYVSMRMARRPKDDRYTFGWKRAEVLAAMINAITLVVISVFLFREAWQRFTDPQPVAGPLMLAVAVIGLIGNVVSMLLLRAGSSHSLNIRSAYMHLLSDAVSSVAVILGGIAIWRWGVYWIDPLLTVLIAVYVLRGGYKIVMESLQILMMATPAHLDVATIVSALEQIHEIHEIHHVHIWALNDARLHFEAHVKVADMKVSESDQLRFRAERLLMEQFGINHVTLQIESNGNCPDTNHAGAGLH